MKLWARTTSGAPCACCSACRDRGPSEGQKQTDKQTTGEERTGGGGTKRASGGRRGCFPVQTSIIIFWDLFFILRISGTGRDIVWRIAKLGRCSVWRTNGRCLAAVALRIKVGRSLTYVEYVSELFSRPAVVRCCMYVCRSVCLPTSRSRSLVQRSALQATAIPTAQHS